MIKDQTSKIVDRGEQKKQNLTVTAQENPNFELHNFLAWSNAILLDECFLTGRDYQLCRVFIYLFIYLFISILNLFYDLGNDVAISIDKEDF